MIIENLTETDEIILKGANRTHNKCRRCGQIKPIEEFCTDKRNSCGHNTLCRECKKEQDREYHKKIMEDPIRHAEENAKRREWKKNNPEKVSASWTEYNARPEVKERKQQWQEEHKSKSVLTEEQYLKEMLRHAKDRATKAGLPFNLELEDLVIPEKCPILETPISWRNSIRWQHPENVPSIDKIVPDKGYVKGNVCIISMMANTMKQNASIEQLLTFCKNMPNYLKKFTEDIVQPVENEESAEFKDKEP